LKRYYNPVFRIFIRLIILAAALLSTSALFAQNLHSYTITDSLQKRVYHYSRLDFITEEGDFNEAICTLIIPDLSKDSPPILKIFYRRENSKWFTESLYRKRVRYTYQDGVIKLDQTNFWDWYEMDEIKVVVLY